MKELTIPNNFDGNKYYEAQGDYPTSHKPGLLRVPDHLTQEIIDTYVTTLDDFKQLKIDLLWQSATSYEQKFISGSAPAKMLQLALQGNEKAAAIGVWLEQLWGTYYTRRDLVVAAETQEAIDLVSEDFSSVGEIPFSVKETIFGA